MDSTKKNLLLVAIPFLLIVGQLLLASWIRWRWACRFYQRIPVVFSLRIAGWTLRTRNRSVFVFGVVGIIGCIYTAFYSPNHERIGSIVIVPAVIFLLSQIFAFAIPPGILLLGSSRPETAGLISTLVWNCSPCRPIALLHENLSSNMQTLDQLNFRGNSLRIIGNHDWRSVVFPIAKEIPLIVVDARFLGDALVEECEKILIDSRLLLKTVFVVNDDGSAPSIQKACLKSRQNMPVQQCNVAGLVESITSFSAKRLNGKSPVFYKYHRPG